MQVSVSTFAALAHLFKLDYELVVVEWNPPPEKERIRELISWPRHAKGRVRFFEVPASVHEKVTCSDQMPFLEYIGKNVAIRRSLGEWVLATTPDVIFNKRLMRFLAKGKLTGGSFYRIDREDVAAPIPLDASWQQRLRICQDNVVRVNSSGDTVSPPPRLTLTNRAISRLQTTIRPITPGGSPEQAEAPLHTNASGDFFLMSRADWFGLRGYTELSTHAHIDSIMCWTAKSAGLKQVILQGPERLYHQEHDRSLHAHFPETDWAPWHKRFMDALDYGVPMIANDEDWGLVGIDLAEYAF